MTPSKESRLAVANAALQLFAPDTRLEIRRGRVWVLWWMLGKEHAKEWQTRSGQCFYPSWYRHWCHGGTCSTALSQLVRWIQDKPVMPMVMWEHWCSPMVLLAGGANLSLLNILRTGGYPEHANCVLCGEQVAQWDWWQKGKVSGPCCHHASGCKQKGKVTE